MKKKGLRILGIVFALMLCLTGILPEAVRSVTTAAAEEEAEIVPSYPYTTVTRDKVNLRAGKSVKSALLKKIPAGAEITVLSKSGSWAEVEYGKYSGYVKTDYIVLKTVKKVKTTPTPTPIPTLSPEEDAGGYIILKRGSSGSEVRALQEAMIELGFLKGTADGNFGAGTESAVIAFQKMNNYPDTGLMDANIQAFLYSGKPKNAEGKETKIKTLSPAAGVTMNQGNTGEAVGKLQQKLKDLGYYTGAVNCQYDAATKAAVKSFQKANGLKADGIAGAETQHALFNGSAVEAGSTPTPTPSPTPTPEPVYTIPGSTVKSGSEGQDARAVQKRLKELGYFRSVVDGLFGKASVKALKAFQEKNGLEPDGIAGKGTYEILFSSRALAANEEPTPTPTPEVTPTATPVATTEAPTRQAVEWKTLRKGDTGDAVAQLQEALIQLGYLSGKADGTYGTQTVNAVKAFQKANGLTADGTAGQETQRALFGGSAKAAENKATPTPTATPKATPTPTPAPNKTSTTNSSTLQQGDKGDAVKALQRQLISLGYLSGSADGVYGAKTASAVKAFQKANKLTADGIAGTKTQNKLDSVSKTVEAAKATPTPSPSTSTVVGTPQASKVIYANWYTTVKAICRKYPYATVFDYTTGISYQVHIFSLGAHADCEPVTANDTARMLKVFGGNTWNPKAVWVIFADGSVYMASTHSNPHGTQHTRDNNFDGHMCIHFPRTQEQVTAIGTYATSHQETIDKGWIATQAMK